MRFSKLDSLYKQLHMSLCKLASHRWCYGDDIFTKRSASTPTTTFALLVSSKAEDLVQLNRFSLVVPLLSQLEAAVDEANVRSSSNRYGASGGEDIAHIPYRNIHKSSFGYIFIKMIVILFMIC